MINPEKRKTLDKVLAKGFFKEGEDTEQVHDSFQPPSQPRFRIPCISSLHPPIMPAPLSRTRGME